MRKATPLSKTQKRNLRNRLRRLTIQAHPCAHQDCSECVQADSQHAGSIEDRVDGFSKEARIDYPHDDSSETQVGDDDLDDEHTEFSSIVDPDENPMHDEVEDTITASLAELFPLSGDEIYDHTIPQAEGLEEWPDFSVDSGAAISVGSPEHFPGIKVVPSEGSRKGQRFMGAGKDSKGIPNMGQMGIDMVLESGDNGTVEIQAAEVRKPLLSVSQVNKKGNPCWFDGERSWIIPKNAQALVQVRQLLANVPNKIPWRLEYGIFKMRSWKRAPVRSGEGPFQRPGNP